LQEERKLLGQPRVEGKFPTDDEEAQRTLLNTWINVIQEEIQPSGVRAGEGVVSDASKRMGSSPPR